MEVLFFQMEILFFRRQYWSAETENKILKSLKIKDINKDFHLFKNNIQNIKTLKN